MAKKGQPGYCPDGPSEYPDDYDSEESEIPDVTSDKAWGFCDQKCHVSVRNLEAKTLQEVRIILTNDRPVSDGFDQ